MICFFSFFFTVSTFDILSIASTSFVYFAERFHDVNRFSPAVCSISWFSCWKKKSLKRFEEISRRSLKSSQEKIIKAHQKFKLHFFLHKQSQQIKFLLTWIKKSYNKWKRKISNCNHGMSRVTFHFIRKKKASTVHVLANWLNSCAKRQFKV